MNAQLRLKKMLVLILGASLMAINLTAYAADAGGGSVKPNMTCMDCGITTPPPPPPAQPATVTRYVITDRLGNPVAKTDSTGAVIWRQTYTPYGETDQQPDPDGPGFTGHRHDAATDLVYMQARYYDPKIGRFLSPDPVTFSPQHPKYFNRYWYAEGNPYKYTDPDGRAVDADFGLGAMARSFGGNPAAAEPLVPYAMAGAAAMLTASGLPEVAGLVKLISGTLKGAEATKVAPKSAKYVKGGKFSKVTKELAAKRAGGKCEYCGVKTTPAQKSTRGVTPPKTEGQTDHIVPSSKGGDNSPGNAAHACRECNQKFSDKPKPHPRDQLE